MGYNFCDGAGRFYSNAAVNQKWSSEVASTQTVGAWLYTINAQYMTNVANGSGFVYMFQSRDSAPER